MHLKPPTNMATIRTSYIYLPPGHSTVFQLCIINLDIWFLNWAMKPRGLIRSK